MAPSRKEPIVSTVTASPGTTVTRQRLTRTLPRATASAGALAAAATTAGAAVLRGGGVPLAVHGKIPLAAFAQLSFLAAVGGGVLLAVLIRRGSAARQRFIRITAGLTALSCAAPAAFADTTASKIALAALHLLAAGIIVPVLARHAD
jgi:hypothetical protein